MDFTKFVSALSNSALYFTRMDLLDDAFEGSFPKYIHPRLPPKNLGYTEIYPNDYKSHFKELIQVTRKFDGLLSKISKANRKFAFINSWHVNESESAAMWRLYLKSSEGIVFQSTFGRLSESFVHKEKVALGLIKYVDDYTKEDFKDFDDFNLYLLQFPFMFKRKCFEYEKELRAIVLTEPLSEKTKNAYYTKLVVRDMPKGLDVLVNLNTLVERVYVSPTAEEWFEQLVRSVIDKYGFTIDVKPSSLADAPTF